MNCPETCHKCAYYDEIFLPRIQFICQLETPAAVYRDFVLWGGNQALAKMYRLETKDLIGFGLERIVHKESLAMVVRYAKQRLMGDPKVPSVYPVFFNDPDGGRQQVLLAVYPLNEPAETFLLTCKADATGKQIIAAP